MTPAMGRKMPRYGRGVSLLELIVVIVLLGILAVAFMTMYGNVTEQNAAGSEIASMTWIGQGVMETLLTEQPCTKANCTYNGTFGVFSTVATMTRVARTQIAGTTYTNYKVTVKVTCATACAPLEFTANAYTT